MFNKVFVLLVLIVLSQSNAVTAAPIVGVCNQLPPNQIIYSSNLANDNWCAHVTSESNSNIAANILDSFRFNLNVLGDSRTPNCESYSESCQGEISKVSLPASIWLFASFIGFFCIMKRRIHK